MDITLECTQDIDVMCTCGELLSAEQHQDGYIRVEPCEECINSALEDHGVNECTP